MTTTTTAEKNSQTPIRIAILGAGISGSACAYFLSQTFKDNAQITVFDQAEAPGGRLRTYEHAGRRYEIGGSILHTSNLYMARFMQLLDLEPRELDKSRSTATVLFDARGPVFVAPSGGFVDSLRTLRHFGVWQFIRFKRWLGALLGDFVRVYKLQDAGFTFTSLEEFLTKLSPRLYANSQRSLRACLEEQRFGRGIADHLANVACLANYCQSTEIDGFVGIVSLAGTDGDLWAVKDGNYQVPKGLLERSGARVVWNARVKAVRAASADKNSLVYEDDQGNEIRDDAFDYVVIGFPVFDQVMAPSEDFQLDFPAADALRQREMKQVNTYVVEGVLRLFPELPQDKRIQCLSVDPSVPYRTVATQLPCDYSQKRDADLYVKSAVKLYKIFSEKELAAADLDAMFDAGYSLVQYVPWLAYPKYPTESGAGKSIPDVLLDGRERARVLYLNSLEWSASCMEICSISARNVALLIAKKEKTLQVAVAGTSKRARAFFKSYEPLNVNAKRDQKLLHSAAKWLTAAALVGLLLALIFAAPKTPK